MPKFAPELPTTRSLQEQHPLSPEHHQAILMNRRRVPQALGRRTAELLAIVGPCGMTLDEEIVMHENAQLAALDQDTPDLTILHRLPIWKPRTREKDWWGLETTNPEAAYRILAACAIQGANTAIEMGAPSHIERYGDLVAFGWKGARSKDAALTHALAAQGDLPVGIKNDLEGGFDSALDDIEFIMNQRHEGDAPATLLFRGGLNAKNPDDWEKQLLIAYSLGDVIVDVAHGGEMAHNPNKKYEKSIDGQKDALKHLIEITRRTGLAPAGVMVEASSAEGRTDPVMPFNEALELVLALKEAKAAARSHSRETVITV